MEPKDRVIVAIGTNNLQSACLRAELLQSRVGMFKIGSELYTAHGPAAVNKVRLRGRVFLDLKYHDIPTTVEGSSREAADLGVHMFTVHCLGGVEMMKAARRGVETSRWAAPGWPKILGATILTSHDFEFLWRYGLVQHWSQAHLCVSCSEEDHRRFEREQIAHLVAMFADDARDAGLDGVVVPPDTIQKVREACGPKFLIVAVGIRQPGTNPHDHTSTMTPREAIKAGADYLVVGRPILGSHDPVGVTQWIVEEIAQAMAERR